MSNQPEADDFDVTQAMIDLGGGFVSGLGALWRRGDLKNRDKLKAAFPELWARYARIAAQARRKQLNS